MRKEFAKYTSSLIRKNKNYAVLLGDISVGLFMNENDLLPKNVFNLGILEQSMISFAAGMSRAGVTPFVHTISPFIIERAYEQIKLDLDYNKTKVILVSANGPYDYNKLGPTHHCSSDVPLIDLLKSINIFIPGRLKDVSDCLNKAISLKSSSYIRLNSNPSNLNHIKPGKLNSKKKNSNILNVFIGESLHFVEKNHINLDDDWMYIVEFKSIEKKISNKYKKIIFWEPYSRPIASIRFKKKNQNIKSKIFSYIYPESMQSGIFSFPNFKCVKI